MKPFLLRMSKAHYLINLQLYQAIDHRCRIPPYRGPAPFHRLTPNKRFEQVFSTVIMAVCSLFNRMLLLTDLIPLHLVYCGQTVMIGCNRTSFEWTRAVRHIYGIIMNTSHEGPIFKLTKPTGGLRHTWFQIITRFLLCFAEYDRPCLDGLWSNHRW